MWIRNPAMNATQYLSPVSDPTDRMKISLLGKLKNILVLSTMDFIRGRTDDDQREKPALYKFYDFTMGKSWF